MPWSYNSSKNPDKEVVWTQYSHFECYMIEVFYQKYINGNKKFKLIPISGGYIINFKYMV